MGFLALFRLYLVTSQGPCFRELLSRLSAMGFEPIGALERVPSLVEKRVWRPEAEATEVESFDPINDLIADAVSKDLAVSEI